MARRTGETTRQLTDAKLNAIFVWCNHYLEYPKDLARKLGREDIKIVAPSYICGQHFRGLEISELVLDHACFDTIPAKSSFWDELDYAKALVGRVA